MQSYLLLLLLLLLLLFYVWGVRTTSGDPTETMQKETVAVVVADGGWDTSRDLLRSSSL